MRTALRRIFENLDTYFGSLDIERTILILKIISFVICIFLIIAIIILFRKIRQNFRKHIEGTTEGISQPKLPRSEISREWESVLGKLETENEGDYKLAVIEADKMLDDVLKRLGYQGEDMGERLKQIAKEDLPNIDSVWDAHRLRNQIVHQPNFQINKAKAKSAIQAYQRALEDLKAMR